jgi:hypothetical protein
VSAVFRLQRLSSLETFVSISFYLSKCIILHGRLMRDRRGAFVDPCQPPSKLKAYENRCG